MNQTTSPISSDKPMSTARFSCLPAYSRSLLKIQLPVSVTLATSRKPVGSILELVPGSILQFNKMCDESLTLEVGGYCVAEGEAVKVGDKFGLRVTSMVLPEERFNRVQGAKNDDAADQPQDSDAPSASE